MRGSYKLISEGRLVTRGNLNRIRIFLKAFNENPSFLSANTARSPFKSANLDIFFFPISYNLVRGKFKPY